MDGEMQWLRTGFASTMLLELQGRYLGLIGRHGPTAAAWVHVGVEGTYLKSRAGSQLKLIPSEQINSFSLHSTSF